jgi:hypothetical protein
LANAVPVCFLHYSIVWAVIEGVDVVAHNMAALSVSLRTRSMRLRICCDGVVGGNTAKWSVLSEKTSTAASARITIDGSAGKVRPATKVGPPAK